MLCFLLDKLTVSFFFYVLMYLIIVCVCHVFKITDFRGRLWDYAKWQHTANASAQKSENSSSTLLRNRSSRAFYQNNNKKINILCYSKQFWFSYTISYIIFNPSQIPDLSVKMTNILFLCRFRLKVSVLMAEEVISNWTGKNESGTKS